ncbi:hypothetical protein GCK32_020898, partial [Trichostrongylus colubriformis]
IPHINAKLQMEQPYNNVSGLPWPVNAAHRCDDAVHKDASAIYRSSWFLRIELLFRARGDRPHVYGTYTTVDLVFAVGYDAEDRRDRELDMMLKIVRIQKSDSSARSGISIEKLACHLI